MEVLTREVERFAHDKKLEIETLNIRENYRKEFMGNISHELKTPLFTVQGYILTLLDGPKILNIQCQATIGAQTRGNDSYPKFRMRERK